MLVWRRALGSKRHSCWCANKCTKRELQCANISFWVSDPVTIQSWCIYTWITYPDPDHILTPGVNGVLNLELIFLFDFCLTYRSSSFSRASLSSSRLFFTWIGLLGTNQAAMNLHTTTTCCRNTHKAHKEIFSCLLKFKWAKLSNPNLKYKPQIGWQKQSAQPRPTRTERSESSLHYSCSLCSCTHTHTHTHKLSCFSDMWLVPLLC